MQELYRLGYCIKKKEKGTLSENFKENGLLIKHGQKFAKAEHDVKRRFLYQM